MSPQDPAGRLARSILSMDRAILSDILSGRVVIACIGNEMRGDDGVGPFLARLIKETQQVRVIDCGETPENFLGKVIGLKPEKVVVIDAAYFGGKAGDVKLVSREEITGGGASTHDAILTVFADYIEGESCAQVFFLAIQPESTKMGEALSEPVAMAAKKLASVINEIIHG